MVIFDPSYWKKKNQQQSNEPNITKIVRDEIIMVTSKSPNSYQNFVSYSDCSEKDTKKLIQEVKDHFRKLGFDFSWKVRSGDKPTNMNKYLLDAGFEKTIDQEMLAIKVSDDNLSREFLPITDKFQFKQVDFEETLSDYAVEMVMRTFPEMFTSKERVVELQKAREQSNHDLDRKNYHIFAYDEEIPIAFSSLIKYKSDSISDPVIGYLGGSGTLPEYQK